MTDWSGGYGGTRPALAKIPVKIHRGVALIRTNDALVAEELLARPKLGRSIIGRLTAEVLLIRPGKAAEVIDELKRMGHTPQVAGGK